MRSLRALSISLLLLAPAGALADTGEDLGLDEEGEEGDTEEEEEDTDPDTEGGGSFGDDDEDETPGTKAYELAGEEGGCATGAIAPAAGLLWMGLLGAGLRRD